MGVRDILRDIPVECPYCREWNATSLESIDLRDSIQCLRCRKSFVIGDVFELLYEEEPLAQKSVDAIVRYATSEWKLKEGSEEARSETQKFLQQVGFEDLLKRTATQLLVHGDAFLKIVTSGEKTTSWELLPAKKVRVKTSWVTERGWKTPVLKEDEFVLTTEKEAYSFSPEEIIHFKKTLLYPDESYGNSMLEITLGPFHNLRLLRRVPPHIQSQFESWREMLEQQVFQGLGVPAFILERDTAKLDTQVAEWILVSFVGEVRRLQRLLSVGFDRAITQFAGQENATETPKIQLKRLTARMVLLDCGFSFAREIESWKTLQAAGVITKEELDAKLKEFEL